MINKLLAWIRKEGTAGQFLSHYERARYSVLDTFEIIVPADAEELADVSFYQAGMDWGKYPHRSAIIRLGQNAWKDTSFETFYSQALARGIALGGYFFWDDRATPEAQAKVIIDAMAGKHFELELYIDVEKFYIGNGTTAPKNIRKLVELVEAAGVQCKEVGIYTGYYFWRDNILPYMSVSDKEFFIMRPLWLAWYAAASVVRVPEPWMDYTLWQYNTLAVDWGQPTAEIDANKSRYSRAEFSARYLGGTTPPNGGEMEEYRILALGLKIRTAPPVNGVLGPDAGKVMVKDDLIHTSALQAGWLKIEKWIKATGGEVMPPVGVEWWCSGSYVEFVRVVGVEPPPPVVSNITEIILDLAPGSVVTIKREDGTQEVETA